ncbi:MAG: SDR family oxidoreductase [Dehalococcoidia bacterium]|nr:SDR family oxidoreductase [Dehalococcoidia bacterium]
MPDMVKGRVAVVTGAGRGIGREVALLLAKEGAKVVVNDLGGSGAGEGADKSVAGVVVEEIKKLGGAAVASLDSVTSMAGGERIIKTALDSFGRIDILVNNAGILRDRMVFNMTEEEWDSVQAVHLKGHFACTKPAAILMRQQRSGRIINFTSNSGLFGNAGQANYAAAKAGIAGFTRVVSRELGRYGITVNAISPNAKTRLTATIPQGDRAAGIQVTNFDAMFPDPAHIAPMVVFLASDAAANINGQIFHVDGPRIELLSYPRPIKTIYKLGRWTLEELIEAVPKTLAQGLVNPAPVVASKQ